MIGMPFPSPTEDGQVEVTVNDQIVYRRPLETIGDSRFGLFRFKYQSAQVRNAKLTGDWPEKLTAANNEQLLASTRVHTEADKRMISELIADRFVLADIAPLLDKVSESPEEDGYKLLKDWVLPNDVHDGYRLQFKFSNGQPETAGSVDANGDPLLICPATQLIECRRQGRKAGRSGGRNHGLQNYESVERKKPARSFVSRRSCSQR